MDQEYTEVEVQEVTDTRKRMRWCLRTEKASIKISVFHYLERRSRLKGDFHKIFEFSFIYKQIRTSAGFVNDTSVALGKVGIEIKSDELYKQLSLIEKKM